MWSYPAFVLLPADKIMQDLIDQSRVGVTATERALILGHIATARFCGDPKPLKDHAISATELIGRPHPSQPNETLTEDTLLTNADYHAVKHTFDGNWPEGTSTTEYVADINAAVLHRGALLDVGREILRAGRGGRPASRAVTRTDAHVLPAAKLHPKLGFCVLVVYDPARRGLVTCFVQSNARAETKLKLYLNRQSL